MRYFATTPSRERYQLDENIALFRFYLQPEGVTWYRVGDDWFQGNYLPDDLVVDELYRGGHEYEVTQAKADELGALGFSIRTE